MGYNTSKKVVVRNIKILRRLAAERKTFSVEVRPASVKRRYYEIREALEAVKHHEEYKEFHHLGVLYELVKGKASIKFRYKAKTADELTAEEIAEILAASKRDYESRKASRESIELSENPPEPVKETVKESKKVSDVHDFIQIISAVAALSTTCDELYFPDAYLEDNERLRLYEWCKESGWKYIDHEGAGITLTRKDIDPFILWEPE